MFKFDWKMLGFVAIGTIIGLALSKAFREGVTKMTDGVWDFLCHPVARIKTAWAAAADKAKDVAETLKKDKHKEEAKSASN